MFFLVWVMMTIGVVGFSAPSTQSEINAATPPPRVSTTARPGAPNVPNSPAKPDRPGSPNAPEYVAEPQDPSGRFLTATEVKPILTATKMNWVAVREYDGNDLVYITHLLAWRCGLAGLKFGVNGEEPVDWPLPPCHVDTAAPNAITADDGLPYRRYPLGSVQSVTVELIYDDLSRDTATFERKQVLMP